MITGLFVLLAQSWYVLATSAEEQEDTLRLPDLATICLGYMVRGYDKDGEYRVYNALVYITVTIFPPCIVEIMSYLCGSEVSMIVP